ncbi:hypothetical protein PYW07_008103 [Mythimna separata]|uniref:ADAMTS/ADAMTS-like Spacer 1 domain-containing protein n=1 Tax=Mythimna separata TaxID=271217 RepID=A0AAD7YRJ7_MYTSE|nr:hypothetical protein PYW07_008103 [Mythimna separata]
MRRGLSALVALLACARAYAGNGLYLPTSYLIPGGEGEGPWGEWGEVSPCSRTCGGGVASQKRTCLQSQCEAFNGEKFRGIKFDLQPYMDPSKPCELNCKPAGNGPWVRYYFQHRRPLIDGTRCYEDPYDVCVNGKCQPVGCDMMLNSTAREDKCRECRGNGANCNTTAGVFESTASSQDLIHGYNDMLLIPASATNIIIEELFYSNNYLALRAMNGTYYLNGRHNLALPGPYRIAGAHWTYEHTYQGSPVLPKLRCLGPTTEPLYLSLLFQDEMLRIRYEYSVPNNTAPPTDKRYNWVHEEFTPCSATCGGGFQTRNVTCRSREELEIVEESLCDEGLRPPTNQSCSPEPCPVV